MTLLDIVKARKETVTVTGNRWAMFSFLPEVRIDFLFPMQGGSCAGRNKSCLERTSNNTEH